MAAYIFKRLLLMIPTLLGIMLISFVIVQFVPGGPVEKMIAELQGHGTSATARFSGGGGDLGGASSSGASGGAQINGNYKGAQGLDPEFIKELEALYGFDKPAHERFFLMVKNYLINYNINYIVARVFNMYGGNDSFSVISKIINSYCN